MDVFSMKVNGRIVKEKSHEYDKTRWGLTCGLYEGMDIYIKIMSEVYTDIWMLRRLCH